mmetsp:Transcript_1247/g.1652  ORF Transcript_1247/g.1652 Transcript_1247/m.1652 type:complete len:212 (+) Transcript_1247:164-799(+)
MIEDFCLESEGELGGVHVVRLGKGGEGVGVEHARVEVDALIPRLQRVGPLLVDVVAVLVVVALNDIFPVVTVEELVLGAVHPVEVLVGLPAGGHGEAPPRLGFLHVLVALLVLASLVVVVRLRKLSLHDRARPGAANDVVTLVDGAFGGAVKQASSPLGGGVIGKIIHLVDNVVELATHLFDLVAHVHHGAAKRSRAAEGCKNLSKHFPVF